MTDFDDPIDSPGGWQREHAERYVATDGAEGHLWNGVPTLLLTTRGRRSGQARRTPLIYGQDGDDYLVVASSGGSDTPPAWYRNLSADPRVRVQVAADRFDATARAASAEEKARLWPVMTAIWPAYDEYQQKTSRDIPVVILSRS
ncbi:nitroreductase family deazaflavin-dependent oxidoreductase [Micromonospora pattaloongensis]|nr:nitroreductase family deazaflavin-dependent oxidoreductase [Micromonospora pattaloongensis]